MNIFDIAKETGYSIATVSRAINNSGYVSEKTREKIMKVIEEKNYSVNAFARGMATSSMSLAGIISTDSRDMYQAECIYYLQKALKENGYTSLLTCSGTQLADKQEAAAMLLSRNVDVIFLIGSQFVEARPKDNQYLRNAAAKVPVILLNGTLKGENIYSLRCDDEAGGYELSSLVLEQGSENPLMVIRRKTYSSASKIRGFERACRKAGIDPEGRIAETSQEDGALPDLSKALQDRAFDSLICADDELAAAALKYCQKNNLSVPEQVQVTGYNNSSLALIAPLEITSYDNRIEFLCSGAVSMMNQIFDKKELPEDSVYAGKIFPRQTTRSEKALEPESEEAEMLLF